MVITHEWEWPETGKNMKTGGQHEGKTSRSKATALDDPTHILMRGELLGPVVCTRRVSVEHALVSFMPEVKHPLCMI